ncbi:MAG TPA: 2-oxoglutarate dehydrogenase E1 component, partial [Candidatus Kryptonia bacterium]|nr:2-oxoglutarate dehydrogenase E1 component [Candidatus Kryptonia bacterium]
MAQLDFINRANAEYVDRLYEQYRADPESVDSQWAFFFAGFEAASGNGAHAAAAAPAETERNIGVFDLIHSYRELGHLVADLDPLGHDLTNHPLLDPAEFGFGDDDLQRLVDCPSFRGAARTSLQDLVTRLRATYSGTLAVEYMEISDKAQRTWLQDRMEPTLNKADLSAEDRKHILQRLTAAEGFEQFLHTKYVGQKRFSLEGGEALIPLLDTLIEDAGNCGVEEIVMGMPHRGRLNVLAHILRKPYEMIFSEFEGTFLPADIQGDGDVKYHLGYAR